MLCVCCEMVKSVYKWTRKILWQKNALLNTIWIWIRIINSCVYTFQGPIKSFIHVLNRFKKYTKLCFSRFFPLWVSKTCFSQDGIYR